MTQTEYITTPCESVSILYGLGSKPLSIGVFIFNTMERNKYYCRCGCGQVVKPGNVYIQGHHRKGIIFTELHRKRLSESKIKYYNKPVPQSQLCLCGCHEWTIPGNKYIRGHNRRGSIFTKEHRKKLSGKRKNIPLSDDAKQQISNTLKKFYTNKENHPGWKGGLSLEPYGKEFNVDLKQSIRKTHGNFCQFCGKSELELKVKLSIHHIDYNKKNNNLTNLIPLCVKCHTKTNSNRSYWQYKINRIMQRTNQNYRKAILVGDMHLREDRPICRKDDFINTQINKLQFIKDLQAEHQCPVIMPGDLFHNWKPSPFMLTLAMRHLPKNLWVVAGNHDLPQHNFELLFKSGLKTIIHTGNVHLLNGTHWNQTPSNPSLVFPISEKIQKHVLVWHFMTFKDARPFPQHTGPSALRLLRKYPQFDLIVVGDNHKPFTERYEDRLLVNPGSFTRQSTTEVHSPRVYLWDAETNTVEPVYLPIEKDIISREHIEIREQRNKRIDAFISKLDGDWEAAMSFEDNLKVFFKANKISADIQSIIYKAIES